MITLKTVLITFFMLFSTGIPVSVAQVPGSSPFSFFKNRGPAHRVFVTSTTYTGNLGGLTGANSSCQSVATDAGLGGTWKAVLSSGTVGANVNIKVTNSIYNLRPSGSGGPQLVAVSHADLWDGSLTAKIEFNETGGTVSANVWTGTLSNGNAEGVNHCSDFTSTSGNGVVGGSGNLGATWVDTSSSPCSNSRRLYCIDNQ